MNPIEFRKTEGNQYPELFDQLLDLLPRLNTVQTAKLGLAISMLMAGWVPGGQDTYLMTLTQIAREQVDMDDPNTARTFGHLFNEVEDHVLRNISQKGRDD